MVVVKCPKCYNNSIMRLYFYLFPEKKREKHSSHVLCFVFMISSLLCQPLADYINSSASLFFYLIYPSVVALLMPVISFHCISFITRPKFPLQRHSFIHSPQSANGGKLFNNNFTFFVFPKFPTINLFFYYSARLR